MAFSKDSRSFLSYARTFVLHPISFSLSSGICRMDRNTISSEYHLEMVDFWRRLLFSKISLEWIDFLTKTQYFMIFLLWSSSALSTLLCHLWSYVVGYEQGFSCALVGFPLFFIFILYVILFIRIIIWICIITDNGHNLWAISKEAITSSYLLRKFSAVCRPLKPLQQIKTKVIGPSPQRFSL